MSDIVKNALEESLRAAEEEIECLRSALEEIERLRSALREIADGGHPGPSATAVAKEALGDEKEPKGGDVNGET